VSVRRPILAVVLSVAVAACGAGSPTSRPSAGASRSPAAHGTRQPDAQFAPGDLAGIVPHAEEAPPGTGSDPSLAHASDLDSFARDEDERRALVADGFESGYVVYFPPLSYFRKEPHAPTDVAFQAIAGLFDDASGASSSLRRFVGDLRTRQMAGSARISGRGLGDAAFGLAGGAAIDGSFVRVYAWRVSNLILVLVASGPVAEEDALDLARTMDARAREAVGASR
jgi:hypothetical protein